MLKLTAETYPFPINMVGTDPDTGTRTRMTTITGEEIARIGYANKVTYKNLLPQDKQQLAAISKALVDSKIIDLDTARGPEFINLRNPSLINKKVLSDMAYLNPDVVKSAIIPALAETDPQLLNLYIETLDREEQMKQMQMQMQMASVMGKLWCTPP